MAGGKADMFIPRGTTVKVSSAAPSARGAPIFRWAVRPTDVSGWGYIEEGAGTASGQSGDGFVGIEAWPLPRAGDRPEVVGVRGRVGDAMRPAQEDPAPLVGLYSREGRSDSRGGAGATGLVTGCPQL